MNRLKALYCFITRGCNLRCRHCYIGARFQAGAQHQPCMDVDLFRDVIRQAKRLGVSYVKLGGGEPLMHPRIGEILEIAGRRKLPVLEDACQAHLGEWRGKKLGTLGAAGCFSFQASKNLNSGEGGAILTSDDALYDRCWAFHDNCRGRRGRPAPPHAPAWSGSDTVQRSAPCRRNTVKRLTTGKRSPQLARMAW